MVVDLSRRLRAYDTLHYSDISGTSGIYRDKRDTEGTHKLPDAIQRIHLKTLNRSDMIFYSLWLKTLPLLICFHCNLLHVSDLSR